MNKELVKMLTELGSQNGAMKAQKECLENELKQCQDDSIMTIKRLQVRPQDSFSTHPQRVSTTNNKLFIS